MLGQRNVVGAHPATVRGSTLRPWPAHLCDAAGLQRSREASPLVLRVAWPGAGPGSSGRLAHKTEHQHARADGGLGAARGRDVPVQSHHFCFRAEVL